MKRLEVTKRANLLRSQGEVAALDATVHALEEEDHFDDHDNGNLTDELLNVGVPQNNIEKTAGNESRSQGLPSNNLQLETQNNNDRIRNWDLRLESGQSNQGGQNSARVRFGEERMDHRFRNNALNNTEAPNNRQSASTGMPSNQPSALSDFRCSRAPSGPTATFPAASVPSVPLSALHGNSSNSESPNQTCRINTPDRSMSQESQLNYAVNRQLALSSLKGNVRAIKFNGKDKAAYAP